VSRMSVELRADPAEIQRSESHLTAVALAQALGAKGPPRHSGRGPTWRGRCPSHSDRHASLDITDAGGMALLVCRAGCSQQEVLEALRGRGLWHPEPRSPWRIVQPTFPPEAFSEPTALECCWAGRCEHWQGFDRTMILAHLRGALTEAAREIIELYGVAREKLDAGRLVEELMFASEFGAIAPWHLDDATVPRMAEIVAEEMLCE
jgi:hypothetical protein